MFIIKKKATLNIKISHELYSAVKAEAESHKVSIATFVRAVLARQVFSNQNTVILGQELLVSNEDGEFIIDI